eukprot:1160060-Pelagomonas_calceolata.AAC.5
MGSGCHMYNLQQRRQGALITSCEGLPSVLRSTPPAQRMGHLGFSEVSCHGWPTQPCGERAWSRCVLHLGSWGAALIVYNMRSLALQCAGLANSV